MFVSIKIRTTYKTCTLHTKLVCTHIVTNVYQGARFLLKGGCQFLCPELAEQSLVMGTLLFRTWED